MVSTFYGTAHTGAATPEIPAENRGLIGFLTADGSRDSHAVTLADGRPNGSPRAGKPYPTATWADIRSLVEAPASRPKDRARLVVLSSYVDHDGRTHAVQRDRGVFHGLAVDIDQGSPTIDAVVAAVQQVTGGARAEVYSSSSAKPENRKWRVLIPLAAPIAGADYADTQLALFDLLGRQGLICDATLSRAAQPVYLPNVPPDRRGDDGQPRFYQYRHIDGPDLALAPGHAIVEARQQMRAAREAERVAAESRAAEYRTQRLAHVEATGDDFEPIQHFKDHHAVADLLSRYGFTRRDGGRGSHWRSPLSQSGSYSTEDRGDHWVTVSNWAHAHNVGRTSASGHRYGDAFDLFVHFEHGGDRRAAVAAYAAQVRPHRPSPVVDQAVPVEPRPVPAGERRTLADWRAEAAARRVEAVSTPGGLFLDHSPTGSGKTHATIAALARASSSLTVLPTHANVEERVREMQAHGIDAVAFPELNAENCQRFDDARRAQSMGLVAGAAVCPGCPFNRIPNPRYPGLKPDGEPEPRTLPGPCHDADQYQGLMRVARDAQHRVGTHERLRRSSRAAEGVQVVVIDETPEPVLAPTLTVPLISLIAVDHLAHGIRHFWHSEATPEQKSFASAMQEVVAAIHATRKGITGAGAVAVDLRVAHDVPQHWQRLLFDSAKQVTVADDLDPEALTLVTKAAAGELSSLEIVTDRTAKGRLMHFVVGGWRPVMPDDAAVICLDATGDAADIAAVTGRPVVNCTPAGHLPLVHPIAQIPVDISRRTSAAVVAGQVEAWLDAHPGVTVGIIGHSHHIRALIEGGLLSEPSRRRVVKWCHFGQGPDRGSNDWHQTCQHLLRLGTPRVNPGEYRRWLVQHGLHDAAGKPEGDWGPKDWLAVTVDGASVTIRGKGYRDPAWHRAYAAISRAAGIQCDGRGRGILPEGIPTTIWSTEPGPYPIAPVLDPTPAAARETAQIVRDLARQPVLPLLGRSAKSLIEKPYKGNCASGAVPAGACIDAIQAKAEIGRRAAQVRLNQCVAAGLLVRPESKRGWYALPDDAPAAAPLAPVAAPPAPPPAVVHRPVRAVVIAAHGPAAVAPAVDVVAESTPATTTAICTSTVQPEAVAAVDDLVALVDERAAFLEFDGGHDRETADRLGREMVLGRDATTAAAMPADDIVAGVDTPSLAARCQPYVRQVLDRFTGTVRVIDDQADPFAGRRQQHRRPGTCQCGHDDWVQVSIHGGHSTRVDCRHCDRFGWFDVWHGQRLAVPSGEEPEPPRLQNDTGRNRLSFQHWAAPVPDQVLLAPPG
jgi:uncharacterized ParB-like nuclease family protein